MHHLDEHKRAFKTMRRKETIGLRRMASDEDMLEKNMWFHLGANTCLQMIYALERATEVAVEHVDNNYNPIPEEYRAEFAPIRDRVIDYIAQVHQLISSKRMEDAKKAKNMGKELREIVKDMRKTQMKRAHKGRREDLRASMVYLNVLIETESGYLTPTRPLLRGTQREGLLQAGLITEADDLTLSTLRSKAKAILLINALLPLEEALRLPPEALQD